MEQRVPGETEPVAGKGPSLDELSDIYAALIKRENQLPDDPGAGEDADEVAEDAGDDDEGDEEDDAGIPDADIAVDVTPASILEAMLFVGNPENEPLPAKQVAALLRGVSPREIDELVIQLNERYQTRGCPYRIDSVGAGYLMRLHPDFARFRDKFYGRIREARLSQQAIDVLAIVAYRPGATRGDIDELRGRGSRSILSQLVRRQLLRVERTDDTPRKPCYFTTERFLQLFGLEQLDELPQSQELEYED